MKRKEGEPVVVAAVSGGPDSAFLLAELVRREKRRILVGHVNHGVRGRDSDRDQKLVERLSESYRLEKRILKATPGKISPGFEERARKVRREFLKAVATESWGGVVAMGHTADDQVETVLMRFFEGAGIGGLKGIPRETEDGIIRPILDVWKEDVLKHLKKNRMPYRKDRSNLDCRFERNWIRNVLIPLLEKRYGKGVKKRIFAMGERFRELDEFLDAEAGKWIRRNLGKEGASLVFPRRGYSGLPAALRVRILQRIGFGLLDTSFNERLLVAMDKTICAGGPSGRLNAGKGWVLANRYDESRFMPAGKRTGVPPAGRLRIARAADATAAAARRIAAGGKSEVFDAEGLRLPLSVRPLRHGDRILPFGQAGEKKLKEILIDRKVPRDERWGRPAVCDSEDTILWVPGVVRSAHAPVTSSTRCAKILSYFK